MYNKVYFFSVEYTFTYKKGNSTGVELVFVYKNVHFFSVEYTLLCNKGNSISVELQSMYNKVYFFSVEYTFAYKKGNSTTLKSKISTVSTNGTILKDTFYSTNRMLTYKLINIKSYL